MQDLWAAIAIAIILEGILPFAHPNGWRKMVAQLAVMPDKQVRIVGFCMMLGGLLLLQCVR